MNIYCTINLVRPNTKKPFTLKFAVKSISNEAANIKANKIAECFTSRGFTEITDTMKLTTPWLTTTNKLAVGEDAGQYPIVTVGKEINGSIRVETKNIDSYDVYRIVDGTPLINF